VAGGRRRGARPDADDQTDADIEAAPTRTGRPVELDQ